MAYTSIADNSVINKATLKVFLRIDSDDSSLDKILDLALDAAKVAADDYCQDTFDPVPSPIEMWVLSVVSLWWERKSPFILKTEFKDLGSVNWGYNYEDYFHGLKSYRREVGFGSF